MNSSHFRKSGVPPTKKAGTTGFCLQGRLWIDFEVNSKKVTQQISKFLSKSLHLNWPLSSQQKTWVKASVQLWTAILLYPILKYLLTKGFHGHSWPSILLKNTQYIFFPLRVSINYLSSTESNTESTLQTYVNIWIVDKNKSPM